jgi:putative addiction module component (TIGR02574 family)
MKIDEILKLSPSRRILLAQQLWDSLPDKDIKLSNPIKQELDRRLKAHKNGEMEYFTREELKQKLASEH